MRFRVGRYEKGVGISTTVGHIGGIIGSILYLGLMIIGVLGVAAFIYAVWPS